MIAVFIQCRLGSTRLPEKALLELPKDSGVNIIQRAIRRVKKAKRVDVVVLVTPDVKLAEIAHTENVGFSLRYSLDRNVLAEFYEAALKFKPDIIVRITGDCPCIDPDTIDRLIDIHLEEKTAITFNRHDNLTNAQEIDGLDVEIFNIEALKETYEKATDPYDLEHVTPWMYENLQPATILESGWTKPGGRPAQFPIKLSVNTQEDYEVACKVYEEFGDDFRTENILKMFGGK